MSLYTPRNQCGTALVISLIMLALVTLMVITALNMGSANFRAVSNTQFRDEAIAAANIAIERRVSSTFDIAPEVPGEPELPMTKSEVDLDNDGNTDYLVEVTPACISVSRAETADPSSLALPPAMTLASTWNTIWDIEARVTSEETGASVVTHSGVRVLLSQAERDLSCPD
jgi:Tfp pilus assembly protein PilX